MNYKFKLDSSVSGLSFLITGGAGFIGSNIVDFLINANSKKVVVLDDLSTGYYENIRAHEGKPNFEFIKGDITVFEDCLKATQEIDFVLHHAALGSVPRSINDPMATNKVNVQGFVNMLFASHKNNVKRFIYASSSSVYGNDKTMPKQENITGDLLSPYAVSKKANELYAEVFHRTYGMDIIGLRYFNVYGPKQNINGPYAAVIPIFITHLINNISPTIFGTGETTRDFTFVENVIQANMRACLTSNRSALNQVYNIAFGGTTSLNKLFDLIASELNTNLKPCYADERKGDIKDSFANIDKAKTNFEFSPMVDLKEGISKTVAWYKENVK